jgi:hypothetical protein
VKQRNNTIEEEKSVSQSPNKASRVQVLDQSVVSEAVTPEDQEVKDQTKEGAQFLGKVPESMIKPSNPAKSN